jgi:hypothetical protein
LTVVSHQESFYRRRAVKPVAPGFNPQDQCCLGVDFGHDNTLGDDRDRYSVGYGRLAGTRVNQVMHRLVSPHPAPAADG